MDHCLSAFRHRYRLGSALLEHFSLQPILETVSELFPSTRKAMFRRKGSTLGRPLIFRDVSIVYHILALPDTCKWQVLEVAVNDMLKACANQRNILVIRHVLFQPAIYNMIVSNISNISELKYQTYHK